MSVSTVALCSSIFCLISRCILLISGFIDWSPVLLKIFLNLFLYLMWFLMSCESNLVLFLVFRALLV